MSDENGNSLGCIICLRNLTADIQKLSQAWNIGLLSGLNEVGEDGGDGNGDDDDNDGNNSSNPEIPDVPKDHKYFKSPQFFEYIRERVNKITLAINAQAESHEE